jgi:polyphosphate kinase
VSATNPRALAEGVAGGPAEHGSERFLNRELSWLDFDRRVLALAEDASQPLLERVRFLAIFGRNLDEFFQVRVAGLQDQAVAEVGAVAPDGRSPAEQLRLIRERVLELMVLAGRFFEKELRPALAEAGIRICDWPSLGRADRAHLSGEFQKRIFPVLTPLAVDPAHPFPYISNLSLNLAVVVRRPEGTAGFARVKVPPLLPRFLPLPDGQRVVPIEQVIGAHLEALFPGSAVEALGVFRVTRDAEIELRESESVDLLEAIESGLRRRLRTSDAVRLEVDAALPETAKALLAEELQIESGDVYETTGLVDFGALAEIAARDRPDLKYAPWVPLPVPGLEPGGDGGGAEVFARLRDHAVLVHHPYDSFERSVEAFVEAAAEDPAVLAIKHTLYRTGGPESATLLALQRAARAGKQVVALVELKARFDEAANIARARALEEAGVHVVYGLVGLKTHAKVVLVVRDEPGGIRRYVHVGTGNYHPQTARQYEDLGLLTASPELGAEVADLFNHLTSASGRPHYRQLLVAPEGLRAGLLEQIRAECETADGRIVIKVNGLSDPRMIDALYEASQAGVEIDLIVRGICCLRPGVPGLSERIRVRSILGRYLEHSRIYRFGGGARAPRSLIGSADLMQRNLDLRVEALATVEEPALQARLEEILALALDPGARAWTLRPDGTWRPTRGTLDVQRRLQELARERRTAH